MDLRKWNEFSEINGDVPDKEFVSGEKFAYLGRQYRLKVNKRKHLAKATLLYSQGKFLAEVPVSFSSEETKEALRVLFKDWYIKNGEKKLKERIELYSPKMLVTPSKTALKEQKMRWGTAHLLMLYTSTGGL